MIKSKFLSLIFVCFFLVVMLVSCGGGNEEVTKTVSEEEWKTQLNSLYQGNFCAVSENEFYSTVVTVTDNLVLEVAKMGEKNMIQYFSNENGMTYIYTPENDIWYKYKEIHSSWNNGVFDGYAVSWETTFGWYTEGIIDDTLPLELLDYDLFTFDEELGAYLCESIEIKYNENRSDFLKNLSISFVDGKLLKVELEFHDDTQGNPVYRIGFYLDEEALNISLPEASKVVTLPTDYSNVEGTVTTVNTQKDWQKAVVDFQKSNQISFVSENMSAIIFADKIKATDGSEIVYYANENGKSYVYVKENNEWRKCADQVDRKEGPEHLSWAERHSYALAFYTGNYTNYFIPELYDMFGLLEYDEKDRSYKLDEYESERNADMYKNIEVSFENGKITFLTFKYMQESSWRKVTLSVVAGDFDLPVIE